jgi:hypothetical protein
MFAPEAHAGKPPKKVIEKLLGVADDLPSKPPKVPDIPAVRPIDPIQGGLPGGSGTGKHPGLLDNLDELTKGDLAPKRPSPQGSNIPLDPTAPFGGRRPLDEFKGQSPVGGLDIPSAPGEHVDTGGYFTIKVDDLKPGKPVDPANPPSPGSMKDNQHVYIEPTPERRKDFLSALNDRLKALGMDPLDPKLVENPNARVYAHMYFHNYVDPNMAENFRMDIRIGGKEYVLIRPKEREIGKAVTFDPVNGHTKINEEALLMPKTVYQDMLKPSLPDAPIPDFKLDGGLIYFKNRDGVFELWGDPHWYPQGK